MEPLVFQVTDWSANVTSGYHEIGGKTVEIDEFIVRGYGRTSDNKTVYVQLEKFQPSFYVKIPEAWSENVIIKKFLPYLQNKAKTYNPLAGWEREMKHIFWGFTNYKQYCVLKLSFYNKKSFDAWSKTLNDYHMIPSVTKKPTFFQVFETNIDPLLRLIHTQNLQAAGWVKLDNYTNMSPRVTCDTYNVSANYVDIHPTEHPGVAKFVIAAVDIECMSPDGSFPESSNPECPIIGIGTTMNYLGDPECFYKQIITLGDCEPIPGVDVVSCKTEKEVMLTWTKMILEKNPDFMTGYHIFGFDFDYMRQRSIFLKIKDQFAKLSRYTGEPDDISDDITQKTMNKKKVNSFMIKTLESSAIGESHMMYYNMEGRVPTDLLKIIQRDYPLGSYKLDAVAGNFIKEQVIQIIPSETTTTIITTGIFGIDKGRSIKLFFNDGLVDTEDHKYTVLNVASNTIQKDGKPITQHSIVVDGVVTNSYGEKFTDYWVTSESTKMKKKYVVYWSMAKDDITPQQLFELQRGDAADRRKWAEYCVQDCVLCNILMEKLKIIFNNIGMANVCSTPLVNIFLRGQGYKSLSLVSKKCRERNHIIPVIKKRAPTNKEIDEIKAEKEKLKQENEKRKLNGEPIYDPSIKHAVKDILEILSLDEEYAPVAQMTASDGKCKYIVCRNDAIVPVTEPATVRGLDVVTEFANKKSLEDTIVLLAEMSSRFVELQLAPVAYCYEWRNETIAQVVGVITKADTVVPVIPELVVLKNADRQFVEKMDNIQFYDEKYEGAIVLDPIKGVYMTPIAVLDYASLYPMSMRHHNISHECLVLDPQYDNLPGYTYYTIKFTNSIGDEEVCRYARNVNGQDGILPEILSDLIRSRNATKAQQKLFKNDPFMFALLEGLQLAFKLTANSLYGQSGATTSAIYCRKLAASTTATGRCMLNAAKTFTELVFPLVANTVLNENKQLYYAYVNKVLNLQLPDLLNDQMTPALDVFNERLAPPNDNVFAKLHKDNEHMPEKTRTGFIEYFYDRLLSLIKGYTLKPVCVYGDTDSIFVNFNLTLNNKVGTDREAIHLAIETGILAGDLINAILPEPHELEYEKTFCPWIILSKKRYVGNLYEFDPDKYKQKSMGIVLKRRDNAPIVKIVVGGVVDKILNDRSASGAVKYAQQVIADIFKNKYPIEKFVVSKTLKSKDKYADWTNQVHAVLADRIATRNPGNAPQANDRIPYAFIEVDESTVKVQGDRVEHPDYIREHKLQLDYIFYLTNQIMKPTIQFLELLIKSPESIFTPHINHALNRRKGVRPVAAYFKSTDNDDDDDDNSDDDNRQKITLYAPPVKKQDPRVHNMILTDEEESPVQTKKQPKKKIVKKKKVVNELVDKFDFS